MTSLWGEIRCIDDASVSRICGLCFFFDGVIKMRSVIRMRKCESVGLELEITAFQPFPYRLLTFNLAPSFLEIGWQ